VSHDHTLMREKNWCGGTERVSSDLPWLATARAAEKRSRKEKNSACGNTVQGIVKGPVFAVGAIISGWSRRGGKNTIRGHAKKTQGRVAPENSGVHCIRNAEDKDCWGWGSEGFIGAPVPPVSGGRKRDRRERWGSLRADRGKRATAARGKAY